MMQKEEKKSFSIFQRQKKVEYIFEFSSSILSTVSFFSFHFWARFWLFDSRVAHKPFGAFATFSSISTIDAFGSWRFWPRRRHVTIHSQWPPDRRSQWMMLRPYGASCFGHIYTTFSYYNLGRLTRSFVILGWLMDGNDRYDASIDATTDRSHCTA